MKKKISELNPNDKLLVTSDTNYDGSVVTVEEFISDFGYYGKLKSMEVYTTTTRLASIDADDVIQNAFECEADNMYEDWYENIFDDVKTEDIAEIQAVFDRIIARNPQSNTVYHQDTLVELDILEATK